ncbi:MAG: zinc ribbon domain-containing protein [Verrucomicrobiota bacterium]|jgi:putative FmdB family regulatory protein|nr:zinc ribbon domain-containing protein [Verrucomicrobiota bacterium]
MPIYEYACSKCKKVFSFLSKTLTPPGIPNCPKCGNPKMEKMMSRFATPRGALEPESIGELDEPQLSPSEEARMEHVMGEIERDMEYVDQDNPRHLAHIMKKMKDALPSGVIPKEFDQAIKRLEKGESPEKIEEEMGDVFGMGEDSCADDPYGMGLYGGGGYSHDSGLYDY